MRLAAMAALLVVAPGAAAEADRARCGERRATEKEAVTDRVPAAKDVRLGSGKTVAPVRADAGPRRTGRLELLTPQCPTPTQRWVPGLF